jgi:5-formyltetrahydrofolate cyclo-ligase
MDDGHIEKWRRQERRRLLAERLALSPEQHRRWSAALAERLARLLEDLPGAVIGLSWPHKAEFDARPLADRLREEGRVTALPRVTERGGRLEYQVWEKDMAMTVGTYGIPIPQQRRPAHPAIVVLPLLGFDGANYRLGYGGGYFDRTLAALEPRPMTVGAGFETARLATIFPRAHDIALDIIVTEATLQQKGAS